MHIDKWRVSFSLLGETVETFITFGEMENYLQTVKEHEEEVSVRCSIVTDLIHHLVLDTPVNVIGLFERRFKDLKLWSVFVLFLFHISKVLEVDYVVPFILEKYK